MSDIAQPGSSATVETKADFLKSPTEFAKHWLDAIAMAGTDEETWRKDAEETIKRYRASKSKAFNILYANTQTVVPALYNSEPLPDVRRRFGDEDPAGRTVATSFERAISIQCELYGFDGVMRAAVKDRQLPGRGVARVRVVVGQNGSKHIECETVQWDDYRHGPAKTRKDLPWEAFRHKMTREELVELSGPEVGGKVDLDSVVGDEKRKDKSDKLSDQFKRATVWEVWDRAECKVYFFAESFTDGPLKVLDDPYRLREFFCTPEPLYAVKTTDTLTPVCEFKIWKSLADEVDDLTARIAKVVKVAKLRGIYDGAFSDAVSKLKDLEDGELAQAADAVRTMGQEGIEKAIWLWPVDQIVKLLEGLYAAREQAKNQLYELTGVADILRGSTQASETATAQQIKAQWGSLRLQEAQAEVQRFARDLFRLMADLMAEVFEPAEIEAMSGVPFRPEVPQQATPEQMMQADEQAKRAVSLIKGGDLQREFAIEIETDSTIRADLSRAQENVAGFVQGFGTFIQSVGPAVQAGMMPGPIAVKLLTSFARNFKLGREAETALDEWTKYLEQQAQQPPKPDPKAEAEAQKVEREDQRDQRKHEREVQKMDREDQQAQVQASLDERALANKAQAAEVNADLQERALQAKVAAANMMPPQQPGGPPR